MVHIFKSNFSNIYIYIQKIVTLYFMSFGPTYVSWNFGTWVVSVFFCDR
jgi:hypothetical protein